MASVTSLPTFRFQTVGWAGGENIRDAINFVSPDQMQINENVILSERGGGRKRLGCELQGTFGAAGDRVLSTYTYYRSGANPQVLIHTTGGQLLYTDDPSANPVVWTQIVAGISTTAPFSYETFLGKCYMSNGVDFYAAWTGTGYTAFPSAPKGKFIRLWKDTMWVAGVPGQDDRIYSSAPGDAETFPVAGFIDISKGDGDVMRALATDGQFLIVGKRDSTHTIYDPVTFANRVVDYEKGFESHFGVAQFEGGIYFLSRRGICRYIGDGPSQVISDRLDALFIPELIALDKLFLATSYVYLDRIGFALPEAGQSINTLTIEYYPRIAQGQFGSPGVAPFVFHRMPVQCFTPWRFQANEQLFASHNAANKWLQVFAPVGTDDGVTFSGVMHTPFFNMGDPINTKYLRELRFLCSGRFDVHIYRNYEAGIYDTIPVDATRTPDLWNNVDEVWGEGVWWLDPYTKDLRKNVDCYGRCFAFRFSDPFEAGTVQRQVWVGAQAKEVTSGEWAIFGMFSEGVTLGKRT